MELDNTSPPSCLSEWATRRADECEEACRGENLSRECVQLLRDARTNFTLFTIKMQQEACSHEYMKDSSSYGHVDMVCRKCGAYR